MSKFNYDNYYVVDGTVKQKLGWIDELRHAIEYRSALNNCTKPKLSLDLGDLKDVNFDQTAEYIEALNKLKEIKLKLIDEKISFLNKEITKE